MLHPKATVIALEQLIDSISNQDLSDIAKAAGNIEWLGINEYVDTIRLARAILDNSKSAKLVGTLTNNSDDIDVAAWLADIIAAVYWKCNRESAVARTVSALQSVQQQINEVAQA